MLCMGGCSGLSANTDLNKQEDSVCDQGTGPADVLVLNLEHLRRDPDSAQDFIVDHTGGYKLLDTKPKEMITRARISKDPGGFQRQARKFGARSGCDLVLVLKTGPYFGRQRGLNPPRRIKDQGYALVVMGQRANR